MPIDVEWIGGDALPLKLAVVVDDGTVSDFDLSGHLSAIEKKRAESFVILEERRHFLFRRCMQRRFVSEVIGWQKPLSDLPLLHGQDLRPTCAAASGICLSFSSSASTYLFGAANQADVGVDIERCRPVADVEALARRFFSPAEADAITTYPQDERSQMFLTIWSAKEAGLKAKGRGIVSGLNSFTFTNRADFWQVGDNDENAKNTAWRLHLPPWREGWIVAVMHRPHL